VMMKMVGQAPGWKILPKVRQPFNAGFIAEKLIFCVLDLDFLVCVTQNFSMTAHTTCRLEGSKSFVVCSASMCMTEELSFADLQHCRIVHMQGNMFMSAAYLSAHQLNPFFQLHISHRLPKLFCVAPCAHTVLTIERVDLKACEPIMLHYSLLKHLHNVETHNYCLQMFLSLKFQFGDDISELN